MGVFHQRERLRDQVQGLPHARGGVSYTQRPKSISPESSPRTWGCFHNSSASSASDTVFPTHVGVFLCICSSLKAPSCLPHARGGVSHAVKCCNFFFLSSPRTWGCFRRLVADRHDDNVFPTHVGVFLIHWLSVTFNFCLPHARGGVSFLFQVFTIKAESSPRTWGCFL